MKHAHLLSRTSLVTLIVVAGSGPVFADEDNVLQEIVVTAQRRSERLQDVPIAIDTFSADKIASAGILRTDELTKLTPGLHFGSGVGNALFIRGVGNLNNFAGAEGGVGFYVDDVYLADPSGALTALNNIERIEVLKGPQGTLFGRNSTGGLIHVITPDPEATPMAKAKVSYESYNTPTGSLYATGGTEKIKANIAVQVRDQREGYGTNLLNGQDINFVKYQSYRGKLLLQPTDSDRVTLGGSYYRDTSTQGFLNNITPGTVTFAGGRATANVHDGIFNTPGNTRVLQTKMADLVWEHRFSNGMTFKSVSAYAKTHWDIDNLDLDFTRLPALTSTQSKDQPTFQQEFLFQGGTQVFGRGLDFTTGLFYFNLKGAGLQQVAFGGNEAFRVLPNPKTKSYSGFAQTDFHLTDHDVLTTGLRYTIDKVGLTWNVVSPVPALSHALVMPEQKFNKLTGRVAYKHNFTDDLMAYGSFSTGYKSGLYNSFSTALPDLVKPETIDAYEAGMKGTFWDHRLQLGINAFHYKYQNLQVTSFVNNQGHLRNAGSARINGAELQGELALPVPIGDLTLNANYGYQDGKYTSFPACDTYTPLIFPPGGLLLTTPSCTGNRLPYAPRNTATLGLDYWVPVAALRGKLGTSTSIYHSSNYSFEAGDITSQGSYSTISAEIWYSFLNDRARLSVYGSNLTNQDIQSFQTTSSQLQGVVYRPPRIIGGAFEYKFGD